MDNADDLEQFWAELLSEEPERIVAIWNTLDAASQAAIRAHLKSMTTEPGWWDVQRQSARAALQTIDESSG